VQNTFIQKGSSKMLMKLTPVVNFINILRAHVAPIFLRQKLQSCVFGLNFFGAKISAKKVHVKC